MDMRARAADEQFRLLVESVTDYAIFLLDPEGRVTSWNPGAERIKGYTAAEIVGRHFSLFYPPEERAAGAPDAALGRAEREGRSQYEGWRVRKDGTRFWGDVVISALRGPGGELRGFAKVTRDMTARKRERDNDLLRVAMFERTPAGIAMADASGRYVQANPAFLRMLGYSADELNGKTLGDVTHPGDAEESWRVFTDLVQGRRDQADFQKRYLDRNGQVIWARDSVARLADADGRLRCVVAMVEDITERRRAHEALRESEAQLRALTRRLVQAEELERRRIARELHDRVGQNLSALNINLDIVLGQLEDAESRRRLEDSLALVDATLQSIESVMADLRPPLLDEYGLAAALAWYAEEYAQRTGIRVDVQNAHDAARALRPEAAVALFRIAQEALNNAAKHSAAKRIKVLLEDQANEIVLSVSDDGRGFAPGQAPRGRWGMTTMRERAEAAGGRLSVESSLGTGTTVRAAVPP
ncbi:MAG: PAS domain S-box protein [Betaproteobacteria bacterium]|nr:MAG: PAS domain S-box protein [Betaproteobacteria bacterium]